MPIETKMALDAAKSDTGWELVVRSGLDGRVRNCGVSRYRDLESQHLQPVSASRPASARAVSISSVPATGIESQ